MYLQTNPQLVTKNGIDLRRRYKQPAISQYFSECYLFMTNRVTLDLENPKEKAILFGGHALNMFCGLYSLLKLGMLFIGNGPV